MIRERDGKLVVTAWFGRTASGKRRSKSATVDGTSRRHWAMARRLEDRLRAELEAATNADLTPAGADPTMSQLLDAYLEVSRMEASTRSVVEPNIRRHIKPRLGAIRVVDLTVSDLDRFYLHLERHGKKDGGPLAPASVQRIHVTVRAALSHAVRWGIVDVNVAARATLPTVPRPDPRPPTLDEVGQLYRAVLADQPVIAAFIRVAAATGARRGEVCGMRWTDIDLEAGVWRKHAAVKTKTGGTYLGETKTGNVYALALDPGTLDLLTTHRAAMEERARLLDTVMRPDGFVFSETADCSSYLVPGTVTRRLLTVRRAHGLEHVELRELRHFAATSMLIAGVDPKTAAARLGHARTSTLTDIYAAWTAPADRSAAIALGGILDGALDATTPPTEAEGAPDNEVL